MGLFDPVWNGAFGSKDQKWPIDFFALVKPRNYRHRLDGLTHAHLVRKYSIESLFIQVGHPDK